MVEVFDCRGVSNIAVRRQLNYATFMVRLILSVLLPFARFEREVVNERIRDKLAISKAKSM